MYELRPEGCVQANLARDWKEYFLQREQHVQRLRGGASQYTERRARQVLVKGINPETQMDNESAAKQIITSPAGARWRSYCLVHVCRIQLPFQQRKSQYSSPWDVKVLDKLTILIARSSSIPSHTILITLK